MMGSVNARLSLAAVCLAVLLAGCGAAEPQLYPFDPPPNIPAGQDLMDVPDDLVNDLIEAQTIQRREDALAAVADGRLVLSGPGVVDAIREHRIMTGMTVEEVVWSICSQPTSVRDQGPPGGHTLLWEPQERRNAKRFWVRFDEWGKASAAGVD